MMQEETGGEEAAGTEAETRAVQRTMERERGQRRKKNTEWPRIKTEKDNYSPYKDVWTKKAKPKLKNLPEISPFDLGNCILEEGNW